MDSDNHAALPSGTRIGKYRLDGVLGQGGFGITYLGEDTALRRAVAIKEYLPAELAMRVDGSTVKPITGARVETFAWGLNRFLEEARTLAQFHHPNIVAVHDVFEHNGTAYMVMQHEAGEGLDRALRYRRYRDEAALRTLLMALLDGLEMVHRAGFVHRDIKPANIIISTDGTPVLIDFGSAREAVGAETRTLTAMVSDGYAPFEQYNQTRDNNRQGPWTDIYSLGAMLYRAVTGRAPAGALARAHTLLDGTPDPVVPAAEAAAGVCSPAFLRAIDRALAFRAEERPQSVAEWRGLLAAADAEQPEASAPVAAAPARTAETQGDRSQAKGAGTASRPAVDDARTSGLESTAVDAADAVTEIPETGGSDFADAATELPAAASGAAADTSPVDGTADAAASAAPPATPASTGPTWRRRAGLPLAAVAGVLVVVVAGAGWWWGEGEPPPTVTTAPPAPVQATPSAPDADAPAANDNSRAETTEGAQETASTGSVAAPSAHGDGESVAAGEEVRRQAQADGVDAEETARPQAEVEQTAAEEAKQRQAQTEQTAAEEAAQRRAQAEQAAAEEAAQRQAQGEQEAAEEAARRQAQAEQAAAEESARRQAQAEQEAAAEAAQQQAQGEQKAADEAAQQQAQAEQEAAEEAAQQQAQAVQEAAEEAAQQQAQAEEKAAEETARRQAQVEQKAAEEAAQRRAQAEAERAAAEAERAARVEILLARARGALAQDRLAPPDSDSAAESFSRVLALEPNNATARVGLSQVTGRLLADAETAMAGGRLEQAALLVERAAAVMPGSAMVTEAEERLETARASFVEAQEAEAQAAEAQAAEREAEAEARRQAEATARAPVPESPADGAEVEQLLAQADEAISALRLTSPAGSSAVDYLRRVQAIDAGNATARDRLGEVVARYVDLADRALAGGDPDKASGYLDRAATVLPGARPVELARQRVAAARDAAPASAAGPAPAAPSPGSAGGRLRVAIAELLVGRLGTGSAAAANQLEAALGNLDRPGADYQVRASFYRPGDAAAASLRQDALYDAPAVASLMWNNAQVDVAGVRRVARELGVDAMLLGMWNGNAVRRVYEVRLFLVDADTGTVRQREGDLSDAGRLLQELLGGLGNGG